MALIKLRLKSNLRTLNDKPSYTNYTFFCQFYLFNFQFVFITETQKSITRCIIFTAFYSSELILTRNVKRFSKDTRFEHILQAVHVKTYTCAHTTYQINY